MQKMVGTSSDYLAAAYSRPHRTIPVWLMRQAGRYMPEFQAVRRDHSFLEICNDPELMLKVTLQPMEAFGFDAAIVFSDILLPVQPLGFELDYPAGGPLISPRITDPADLNRLRSYDPTVELSRPLDGINLIRRRLAPEIPLLGFVGSPFTLMSYLIEGGGSRRYSDTKRFILIHRPEALRLLDVLSELLGEYLKQQIVAGADGVVVFDSIGGILGADEYKQFSLPFIHKVLQHCAGLSVPRTVFVKNTSPFLHYLAELNCEVLSLDWHVDLERAGELLEDKAIQGNLDPGLLFGPRDLVVASTKRILDKMAWRDGFIFSLGHGIMPGTPVENVRALAETVRQFER
jgi:uroporphyrinogen decarboxylase